MPSIKMGGLRLFSPRRTSHRCTVADIVLNVHALIFGNATNGSKQLLLLPPTYSDQLQIHRPSPKKTKATFVTQRTFLWEL